MERFRVVEFILQSLLFASCAHSATRQGENESKIVIIKSLKYHVAIKVYYIHKLKH